MNKKKQIEKILLKLLSFDTQNFDNKPGNCTLDLLEYVKNRLERKKIRCHLQEYFVPVKTKTGVIKFKRANLIAYIKKKNKPFFLLQGHVDTVPFDNVKKFKFNPLGERVDDFIVGRGAVDMKGPIASLILALEELAEKKELKYSPLLVLTSDEEANGLAGIKHFIKRNKKKILFGLSAEPTDFKITTGLYGTLALNIETFSKNKRRSNTGRNAIEEMSDILSRCVKYKDRIIKFSNKRLGESLINLGKIKGGNKINMPPLNCRLEIAIRTVYDNGIYLKTFYKKVLEKTQAPFRFKVLLNYNPFQLSDSKITRLNEKLINEIKKVKKMVKTGPIKALTEATILNNKGIPTTVFGPGNIEFSHLESDKEKIKITDIIKAKEVYKNLFID